MKLERDAPAFVDERLDCLAALAIVLDLANGLAEDKSLLAALFAFDLAAATGSTGESCSDAFVVTLLRHLGCSGYAFNEATFVEDDIALRHALLLGDSARTMDVARALASAAGSLPRSALVLAQLATRKGTERAEWTHEACGAAHTLAEGLGVRPAVLTGLDEVYERWDGRGFPKGLAGRAISPIGRISTAAHLAMAFSLDGGGAPAIGLLMERSGTKVDPELAALACERLGAFMARVGEARQEELARVEATLTACTTFCSIEELATVFGDFSDLQSAFTRGHSRHVARLAASAAHALRIPAADTARLELAAHLHDLGSMAVPTAIWERKRGFSASDRERARTHTYFTERVLATARALAPVAEIAAAHHERLDGAGYHRGLRGPALGKEARILCAADVFAALCADRPHRSALSRDDASRELRRQARDGGLDPECVDAILSSNGLGQRGTPRPPANALTERELGVLRLMARGLTNKQIAARLSISDRTVQTHTIRIYAKLGVDTRAGAAVAAARAGLLDLDAM